MSLRRNGRPTLCAHLSLMLQITLVANHDYGEIILVLDTQYLLLEGDNLVEALSRCDAVDQKEALAGPHILLAHGRVFLLTGGIKHIQ